MEKQTYLELRDKMVVKANDLIQKSRFHMTLQQQKLALYLISQVSSYDEEFKMYEFSIQEFCKVCGMNSTSGKNYQDIKQCIKELADISVWIKVNGEEETLLRWIEKPYINSKSGMIRIRLDEDMKPFLLQLKENFTKYELIYTLYFKSKYSIRLYELAMSLHYSELEEYRKTFSLEDLQTRLDADNYTEYRDFRRRVLDVAVKEINEHSDKIISYNTIKKGRNVAAIELVISSKSIFERLKIRSQIEKELGNGNQMTLFDRIKEKEERPD